MELKFNNYEEYVDWIGKNWESKTKELDLLIINSGLLIERKCSCNGEPYRSLTRSEFCHKFSKD